MMQTGKEPSGCRAWMITFSDDRCHAVGYGGHEYFGGDD
jgi:hypothetical protein